MGMQKKMETATAFTAGPKHLMLPCIAVNFVSQTWDWLQVGVQAEGHRKGQCLN